MTKDFDIARKLVTALQELQSVAAFVRDPCKIHLTHDEHIEAERIQATEIRVSPEELTHTRIARAAWQDDSGIRIKLVGKSLDRLDATELEQWFAFADQITDHIKAIKIGGNRSAAITLRGNKRYDQTILKEFSVYSTTLLVGYLLT